MKYGIKVKIIGDSEVEEEFGYILRRLNSCSYEIWLENSDEVVILSPEEFKEITG